MLITSLFYTVIRKCRKIVEFPYQLRVNYRLQGCIQKFPDFFQTDSGAHSASIQWVSEALSLGVKRQGREANHL
jgi:hypothetical protein